jgi:superfamily II DNA or RNA helicase
LKALDSWRKEFKGVVSVVTGGGKTLFAEMCIVDFCRKFPSGMIVIIVPTAALLDQWYVSLQEDLGLSADDISCFSGQEKSNKPTLINIFIINTARHIKEYISEEKDLFLIVDECHRAGSAINSLSLQLPHIASLGISATPERQYDDGFDTFIAPALGPIIFSYDYEQAYHDKVICPFELLNIKVEFISTEQKEYDALTRKIVIENEKIRKQGIADDRLKRLLQQRASVSGAAFMRIPIAVKIAQEHLGNRVLVFHERVNAANLIYKLLMERNHSVTIYHSKIGPFVRRDNLRLYRRGVFDSIVSCKALDEGLNVPDTNVALIASSTASFRQRIQRMGRVLRPAPGKEIAKIITLYVTDSEERRLLNEASTLSEITNITWFNAIGEKRG